MPKNKGRGGKNFRRGKNENETKRELIFKEEDTEYAKVLKMLGNGRIEADCFDGKRRLAEIRGKMKKKVWIQAGDVILVGLRDFQEDKCDVIHKYNGDELKQLIQFGEIPENTKGNEDEGNDMIDWGGEEEDKDDMDNGQIDQTHKVQPQQQRIMPDLDDSDSDEEEIVVQQKQKPTKDKKKEDKINIDDL